MSKSQKFIRDTEEFLAREIKREKTFGEVMDETFKSLGEIRPAIRPSLPVDWKLELKQN